ncbi:cell division protein FtsI (penicillin-binding protein 3) [Labedella gwakjiensis]|uniref:Cell division protein FtsI (Penicillin-binding protein 3) n=1 Tax=Labedella gwakjiensis TaxID=390269 RepID=A0A2P8GZJ8_9MICO|nr:penicillin-binding protein 2 [Labedella gwakjiensis]PSL39370.1 cell division protein FtsI (penicillin-binding protein 3) [Labedella gwakjiensis]RUQ86218.1 penicillin-binding protein 2 [Labedella gwakjiensis]
MPQHTRSSRRRMALAIVCVLAVVGAFVVRLVDIQVVQADQLRLVASSKTASQSTVYGTRGEIVDTNGNVLAGSVMRYDITMDPSNVTDFTRTTEDGEKVAVTVEQAAGDIGAITGQKPEEILGLVEDALAANPSSTFAFVKRSVDVDAYQELRALNIPWLYSQKHPGRIYPNGAVAGNVLGFVGSDGTPLQGLEKAQNDCLASINGTQTFQRGKDGVILPGSTETVVEAKDGGTLKLTIDRDLQWFAQQRIADQVVATGGDSGTVTIMEAKTGKIRAIAQYPSVDPGNVGGTEEYYRQALSFTAPFEPGSTFKALTAAMLLDSGKATPSTKVVADGWYYPQNGARIKDSVPHGPMKLTLTGVLAESSNTGISQLGEALTPQERYDYLKKFGIGDTTSIGFDAESSGILSNPSTWDNQTYYATMFGQGLSATPIQIASAYQALANGGVKVDPTLVEGCENADGTVSEVPEQHEERVVSESAADQVVQMLESVVTDGHFGDTLQIPGYRVAAKSGTAEQGDGSGGLKDTYVVSMTGMAPAEDPEYIVSVHISNPTKIRSSAAAAPTFQQIMTQVLKTYRVEPSTEPSPDLPTTY